MGQPIKILIVEDSEDDALLLLRQVRKGGFEPTWRRVETPEQLEKALESETWDIILSDYNMPRFSGEEALRLTKSKGLDIPFIVISGILLEETAVDLLKAGAGDFIKKGNWARLIPAIEREVREAASRTDRRRAQKARKEAEARYQSLFENMVEGIFMSTPEGLFLNVNPAMARMLGYDSPDDLVSHISDIGNEVYVDPERRRKMLQILREKGSVSGYEAQYYCKDGTIVWVAIHARAVFDEKGNLEFIEGMAEEITQRKAAEKALRRAEEKYRSIFENAIEGIFQTTPEGRCISANPAMARILGFDNPSELISSIDNVYEQLYVEPLHRERFFQAMLPRNRVKGFESQVYRKDGEIIWISENTRAVRDDQDNIVYFEGFVENITERKRSEEDRVRLATAIEQAAEGVLITDHHWVIQYINPSFEKISGYGREEIVGQHTSILKSGKHKGSFYDDIKETLRGGDVWAGRLLNRKKDGTQYEAEVTASPVRDEVGQIINFVSVHRDITHEARLERQLRQAQKMEAIGTLAGGIAHDFNNILTAIMCYSEMALAEAPKDSQIPRRLDRVLMGCQRARELVSQIITFSRQKEHEHKPILINSIIKETLKLLRSSLPRTIDIKVNIQNGSSVINADPTQIHQVLMNLCTNASHAMREKGGVMEVKLEKIDLDEMSASRHAGLSPGAYVRLVVSDTGHGMDRATMERIFEPFFTTKKKEEGTGMGLSVTHGIVKGLGGEIVVYSEPGVGSIFHAYFPRIESKAEAAAKPIQDIPPGTETILFVDDEPILVEITTEMLESIGYKVVAKTGSIEALETFMKEPDQFDLIITDMTMPKMTGEILARECMRIRPEIPVVLCTGFSELITEEKARSAGIRAFLMKPLLLSDLAKTIRKVLDEKPAPKKKR